MNKLNNNNDFSNLDEFNIDNTNADNNHIILNDLDSKVENTMSKIKRVSKLEHKNKLKFDNLQKQLDLGNNVFSYKQLCELLEDDFTNGGKARQNQLIFWKYFIDMYLVGYKWHVNKIYDIPLMAFYSDEKSDFYAFNMYIIISLLLNKNEILGQKSLFFSINELASILGYINANFLSVLYSYNNLAKVENIPVNIVDYFFKNTRSSYSSIITTSLDKMQKFGIIYYQKVLVGNDLLKKNSLRCLSSSEIQQLSNISDEAFSLLQSKLEKQNYPHKLTPLLVFSNSKLNNMFFDIKSDLIKDKLHLIYVKNSFQIFFNPDFLSKIKEEFIKEIDSIPLEQRIIDLNNSFMKKRKSCFENYYNKKMNDEFDSVYHSLAEENDGWGSPNLNNKENKDKFFLTNYKDLNLKSFSNLVDSFLKIDKNLIRGNINFYLDRSDNNFNSVLLNDINDILS